MLALRPYLPLRMVLTVCGQCFSEDPDREIDYETDILQGNLVAMDDAVYLRRVCRRGHGEVMSLYEEDHALWEDLQQWRIPTREITPDTVGNTRPIPMGYMDGLGDLQTQHSCILLIDVTENCNLHCPTCFADSGPGDQPARPAAAHPAVTRRGHRAGGRPGGRPDALRRGADGASPDRRDHRGGHRAEGHSRRPQHERHPHRARRPLPGRARAPPRSGRGLPAVRRVRARDPPLPSRRGPSRDEGRGDPPAHRRADLHDARDGRRQGRQRPRGRRGRRLRLRDRLHRRRGDPADVHRRPGQPDRPDGLGRRRPGRSGASANRPASGSVRPTSSRCRAATRTARR